MTGSCHRELYVHLVWATRQRAKVIPKRFEGTLWAAIADEARRCGCGCLAVGGMPDHIHALIELSPVYSVAEVVKQIKGSTSHLMTRKFHPLRWQEGYGAFTLRKREVPDVVRYIVNQPAHHRDRTTCPTWELGD